MWSPCLGAHRFVPGGYNGFEKADIRRRPSQSTRRGLCGDRDTVPVTMRPTVESASGESWGRLARAIAAGRTRPADRASRPAVVLGLTARRHSRTAMLRIIHTADVHLGARHDDLGEQAAAQRERQFAAFKATVDLAIAREGRPVPDRRRPVRLQRPAAPLRRARGGRAQAAGRGEGSGRSSSRARTTCYDRASIYRAYDLAGDGRQHARRRHGHGPRPGPAVRSTSRRCDVVVHGPRVRDQAGAAQPARRDFDRPTCRGPAATWHVGMVHGSIAIPGKTDRDEVVITTEEIAASGLDYLALGHWHSAQAGQGRRGHVRLPGRARGGRPRPGPGRQGPPRRARRAAPGAAGHGRGAPGRPDALRQDRASTPRPSRASRRWSTRSRRGRTRTSSSTSVSTASGPTSSTSHLDEIETALAPSFLKVRVRDASHAGPDRGPAAVAGHDRRRLHPRPRGADRGARGGRLDRRGRRARATRSGSGACCSPATRCRCEGPPAQRPRLPALPRRSTSSSRPA